MKTKNYSLSNVNSYLLLGLLVVGFCLALAESVLYADKFFSFGTCIFLMPLVISQLFWGSICYLESYKEGGPKLISIENMFVTGYLIMVNLSFFLILHPAIKRYLNNSEKIIESILK